MTTMTCDGCGATTTNGLVLCDLCQMGAAKALEFFPVYFRNLARWRPGRAGSRPVPGSREPRIAVDGTDRVGIALNEAGNAITTWVRDLVNDRPMIEVPDFDDEGQMIAGCCRVLAEHLTSIGTLSWAGEFVRQIGEHEERLRGLTETVAPGWYAGGCKVCDSGTYVVPGLTWVTCRCCGSTTYARDHLDTILTEARGWVARPKALAEAIVAMVDGEQSVPQLHDRIRQWQVRGRIIGVRRLDADGDETGPRRYALGDVIDVLFAEAAEIAAAAKAEKEMMSA